MYDKEALDKLLADFLQGKVIDEDILAFSNALEIENIDNLMRHVEQIGEPHDYMDDLNEYIESDNIKSEVIARGFFDYVDLIAALILVRGEKGIDRALAFPGQGEYGIWVRKYVSDARFQKDIRNKFSFLGI